MAVSKITDSSGTVHDIEDERVVTATSSTVGMVKPDNQSITIDGDGTLHSPASSNPFSVDSSGYIVFDYDLI